MKSKIINWRDLRNLWEKKSRIGRKFQMNIGSHIDRRINFHDNDDQIMFWLKPKGFECIL